MTKLLESGNPLEASSLVWYEFARGPGTPEQLVVARDIFGPDGIIPFSEELAEAAADAVLLTRNARDFAGLDGLVLEQVD